MLFIYLSALRGILGDIFRISFLLLELLVGLVEYLIGDGQVFQDQLLICGERICFHIFQCLQPSRLIAVLVVDLTTLFQGQFCNCLHRGVRDGDNAEERLEHPFVFRTQSLRMFLLQLELLLQLCVLRAKALVRTVQPVNEFVTLRDHAIGMYRGLVPALCVAVASRMIA